MSSCKTNIVAGDKVAFNNLDDAVWFDVVATSGWNLELRETGTKNAIQIMDCGYVKQWKRGSK